MEQYITPGSLADHRYKKQYKEKALISAATPIGAVYDWIPANNYNYHSMESGERDKRKMAYEVINEKLKVEACRIGDLTMDQVESFLKLWGDGEKIETLTLFSRQDGTIVLNRDNKNYPYYKDIVEAYLEFDEDTRKKMEVPEGARETLRVLDRAIEQRKLIEVLDMLKYSYIGEVPVRLYRAYSRNMILGLLVYARYLFMV